MNALIVDYDAFARDSKIYVMKDGKRKQYHTASNLNELATTLIDLSRENNIYDVKVHAPFVFTGELNRIVKEQEMIAYSINKISVEGL